MTMFVTKTDARAKLPTRGTEKSAGLDLYSIETRTLRPGKTHLFKLGIEIQLPEGCEGQIRPRSGLASKHGVTVLNAPGTVDEDYRGEIGVLLINLSLLPVLISEGDRIAQLVVSKVHYATVVEDKIDATERGDGGFGSTGV
jgi:dUTP pyrophosphatase